MRALSLGGILGPAVFVGAVVVAAALRPDYSHVHQFISDLGATGSAHAALMNYGGFVPGGLLLVGFGASLAAALPRTRLVAIGSALTVVFGAGIVLSGLFSCDPGCPQVGGSLENTIHDRMAPVIFLSMIVGASVLGAAFRRSAATRGLGVYSFVTSAAALALLVALVGSLESRDLTGLWQRLMLAVLFAWCAVVGVTVYRGAATDPVR